MECTVDQRFRLAKSAGMLPEDKDDAVQRLERLFALVCDCLRGCSWNAAENRLA